MSTPPRWDMSNVYPSLESKEFEEAVKDYKKQAASLKNFFDKKISTAGAKTPTKELAVLVGEAINRFNKIQTLSNTIGPFIYAYVSTNSRDKAAMRLATYELCLKCSHLFNILDAKDADAFLELAGRP